MKDKAYRRKVNIEDEIVYITCCQMCGSENIIFLECFVSYTNIKLNYRIDFDFQISAVDIPLTIHYNTNVHMKFLFTVIILTFLPEGPYVPMKLTYLKFLPMSQVKKSNFIVHFVIVYMHILG